MGVIRMFGVDLNGASQPPTTTLLEDRVELYKWFDQPPDSESTVYVRILCVHIEGPVSLEADGSDFKIPLPDSVIESALWGSEIYNNLTSNPAGGAAGLIDAPWRFILQTPMDGGPFCSMALSCKGHIVKGIYCFDDESFNPAGLGAGDAGLSAWRSSGLQIVTLPQKLLQAHSVTLSQRLARTVSNVKSVETAVTMADQTQPDVSYLGRILHCANMELVDIERRSRFEQSVVDAIETIVKESRQGTIPWTPLSPQRAALASRQFDFESLPRRIENARTTISSLIQQHNEKLNLELTQASHRIAEATLSDARSMKTIAILTMVLLPATAVASLFSMNLFDWSASDGSHIANKWLWIYFVVTIPLTMLILASWWFWNRRSTRSTAQPGFVADRQLNPFRDEELGRVEVQASERDPSEAKPDVRS